MKTAPQILDQYYHEMRWRILSLAADFDRIQRAEGGNAIVSNDPKVAALRECLEQILSPNDGRAERVQLTLSLPLGDPRKA